MLKRVYKNRAKSIKRPPEDVVEENKLDRRTARCRATQLILEADEFLTRTQEEQS